jgi:hypothetical protein
MIVYKDTVTLYQMSSDGYGDKTAQVVSEVPALFLQQTGNAHSNNADIANSDAHVYLDPAHAAVIGNGFRLEGMYIVALPHGQVRENTSWYRITRVVVGQRKLLDNNVDNVHAYLRRVSKPNVG